MDQTIVIMPTGTMSGDNGDVINYNGGFTIYGDDGTSDFGGGDVTTTTTTTSTSTTKTTTITHTHHS